MPKPNTLQKIRSTRYITLVSKRVGVCTDVEWTFDP
jgi:hypothetical protein